MTAIKSMSEIVESDEFAERITEIMLEKLGSYIKQENGRPEGVNNCATLAYLVYHQQEEHSGHILAELFYKDIYGLVLDMYRAENNQMTEEAELAAAGDRAYDRQLQDEADRGRT